MKRRTTAVFVGVVVLIAAAASYVVYTGSLSSYTTKLQCTQSEVVVFSVPVVSGSITSHTGTTTTAVTTYSTTANSSASAGRLTNAKGAERTIAIRLPANGSSVVSISSTMSCTYVK